MVNSWLGCFLDEVYTSYALHQLTLQGLPSQSGVVKALSVAVNTFSGDVNPQLGTVISIRAL